MTPDDILKQATDIITGKRDEYGEPENNFDKIARICDVLELGNDPQSVALRMVVLKLVRAVGDKNNVDHYVDMAGYAAHAGAMCEKHPKWPNKLPSDLTIPEGYKYISTPMPDWYYEGLDRLNKDTWHEWNPYRSLEPPYHHDLVDVKFLDGEVSNRKHPKSLRWQWLDLPSDITHWRPSK